METLTLAPSVGWSHSLPRQHLDPNTGLNLHLDQFLPITPTWLAAPTHKNTQRASTCRVLERSSPARGLWVLCPLRMMSAHIPHIPNTLLGQPFGTFIPTESNFTLNY